MESQECLMSEENIEIQKTDRNNVDYLSSNKPKNKMSEGLFNSMAHQQSTTEASGLYVEHVPVESTSNLTQSY